MPIVEVELHFLGVAVDLWERNCVPQTESKMKLSMPNLMPASSKHVPGQDAYFRGRLARVITSTFKADASECNLFVEFNFDPGPLVVSDVPLVPLLLTWTEQVLRAAANSMMLCSYSRSCVEMIALQSAGLDLYVHKFKSNMIIKGQNRTN